MFECNNCGEEYTESKPYSPDLAEVSKKIIEGLWLLNTYRSGLEDVFGECALDESNFDKGQQCLYESLDIITAPEGMDENVMTKIFDAKVTESSLNTAIENFLAGAGLI